MKDSEKNLIEFYQEIGRSSLVKWSVYDNYEAVTSENGSWPQMIFFPNSSQISENDITKTFIEGAQQLPDFAICNMKFLNTENQRLLKNKNIYPIESWTLMKLKAINWDSGTNLRSVTIRKLTLPDELDAYKQLLNTELLASVRITRELVQDLARSPAFEIYGIFDNDELISGLSSFSRHQTTGFYFIVTRHDKRGKKHATSLINAVINLCAKKGIKKFVLQAVNKAIPLYSRIGFAPEGKLVIFWKKPCEQGINL